MRTIAGEFTKGLWEQIPPFKLVLGLCPTLAVTKSLEGGWGMGVATTFVLVMSNVIISLLKDVIPPKVRIATFIVVIATFVVITELVMKAYTPLLSDMLGVFIPLIVVNCIILGRAEAFASKNTLLRSFLDGLGIGLGFTISLSILGAFRELLGLGKLTLFSQADLSLQLVTPPEGQEFLFRFMIEPPGAFICLGGMLLIMNVLSARSTAKA